MARDKYHQAVKTALQKAGWNVTHDPLRLQIESIPVLIDLGAERLIAAERNDEKIAIEIKTFGGNSDINDFHVALGQYLNYQVFLHEAESNRTLFIAVPEDTWFDFFQNRVIQKICQQHKIRFLVYNSLLEEVILWTSSS